MNSTDDFGALMKHLDEPAPPASLRANVMARIARDVDRRHSATADGAARVPRRESSVWLRMLAGLAVVLSANVYAWLDAGSLSTFIAPRIGPASPALIPMEGPAALVMGLGLLIYLAGLLAPLRDGNRR